MDMLLSLYLLLARTSKHTLDTGFQKPAWPATNAGSFTWQQINICTTIWPSQVFSLWIVKIIIIKSCLLSHKLPNDERPPAPTASSRPWLCFYGDGTRPFVQQHPACDGSLLPVFEWRVFANRSHESPGENRAQTDSLVCVKWRHAEGSAGFLCRAPARDSAAFCFTHMLRVAEERLEFNGVTYSLFKFIPFPVSLAYRCEWWFPD